MDDAEWGYADKGIEINFNPSGLFEQPKYPHSQGLTVAGTFLAILVILFFGRIFI